ncbi:MAG: SDR family NAD(P)-dependent oxidoreductase [Alphaproteobacteria bacterium]|nr:SDR family NAD(P)-dependent oxidoreductase [Alphaproteobacteria bacterium]
MKDFMGKTAVITGAASGIGRAVSLAFADRGAKLVMADVEADGLEAARQEAEARGAETVGVVTDVTQQASVEALADAAWARFGAVHIVHNNAGVLIRAPMLDAAEKDWEWILAVNLWGVIHGVRAFVPRMLEAGEEGHIVNTASEAGHFAGDGYGVYNTSKFAVVGLTESLARELRNTPLGVSMLCPGQVETGIFTNTNRPASFQRNGDDVPVERRATDNAMEPADVAAKVLAAVEAGELYVFSHVDEARSLIEKRHGRLMRGLGN